MAVITAVSGCGVIADKQLEQMPSELAETVVSIKARLVLAEDVDAAAIRLNQQEDAIVLTGFVASARESQAAKVIAQQAASGREVVNEIVVR